MHEKSLYATLSSHVPLPTSDMICRKHLLETPEKSVGNFSIYLELRQIKQ